MDATYVAQSFSPAHGIPVTLAIGLADWIPAAQGFSLASWSSAGLLALGAFHGVNPGMGWLFAVALGMQERRRAAVCRAMMPLALGHALAIAATLAVAAAVGAVVPLRAIRWVVAGVLLALGVSRFFRHGHPRWVGMQVSMKDLTVWSFLMASAHGAGLMVLPFVLRVAPQGAAAGHGGHTAHAAAILPGLPAGAAAGLAATVLHTAGYLAVTAVIALVVYHRLGLRLLRTIWVNLDLIWGAALVATGIGTLVV